MNFQRKLKEYMELLSCTAKELCDLSGVSAATFSRYAGGKRVPEPGTKAFEGLCAAIAQIAAQKGIPDVAASSVKEAFMACDDFVAADKELLRQNFNTLLSAFNVNLTLLCQYTNYDASTIFRIRNGTRKPGDAGQFASAVASFVARKMQTPPELAAVAELIGCDPDTIADVSVRHAGIKNWLLEHTPKETAVDNVAQFLDKLDSFDLNEYVKTIPFDFSEVPSAPLQPSTSKTYFGIQEMMESELDFIKATMLSESTAPITMYSDMPMKEMAKDPEFSKRWILGIAMLLKKGLHINQIHHIDRSMDEMMLGLESWIPMYMTGQISPYYFKNTQNNVFLHLLRVSGYAALSGEAIAGYHADGKYYLTRDEREVEYYRNRADEMLKNAHPLMDIYRSERKNEWNAFLNADAGKPGDRRSILSTLPLYTMSKELLDRILTRHGADDKQKQKIESYIEAKKRRIMAILASETIEDEIPAFTPEEFRARPPVLELSGAFCEADLSYTEEEYAAHLRETQAFAGQNPNYSFKQASTHPFRNIQILIHEGQWAMVSKGKAPVIHFVIRHPKLRSAIESFIPPITDGR